MKYVFTVLFFLVQSHMKAQLLRGLVISENGTPLENVALFNSTSGAHTHSLVDGTFQLDKTVAGDQINISHLGYESFVYEITDADLTKSLTVMLLATPISLEQIVITPNINTFHQILSLDLATNPVKSSQELLRKVPGLFIGQHAGGGKAEQIFLRGFDIDHGTDVNISVDGLPVNMVSHAHGQGYSDLHFLIPETIHKIDFGLGPYYAERGDFTTAGYVAFKTLDRLKSSNISVEYGAFDSFRTVGLFKLMNAPKSSAYIATALNTFNGPFESPQNFIRLNVMGKYLYEEPNGDQLKLTTSHFQSRWDASGQIPERAVNSGMISRFGSIDDTEGGYTGRTDLSINYKNRLQDTETIESLAYYSHYHFKLYSNFTFFLNDPVNGDQIVQQEDRNLFGLQSVYKASGAFLNRHDVDYSAGVGFRYDDSNDVGLFHTKNRNEILDRLSHGNIDQINSYIFLTAALQLGKFNLSPSIRLDHFKFNYENFLSDTYDNQNESAVIASPKFNLYYNPTNQLQLFLKTGIGFHSNDTRVVIANKGEDILPKAYGTDLGFGYKARHNLFLNASIWLLSLAQEFVYVGDAGVVEPSGKTLRQGIDLGFRYEPFPWLYVFNDLNATKAQSVQAPNGNEYIPLAPLFTTSGGISFQELQGFSGGINYRWLGDRPATEDYSLTAEGYMIMDLNLNYTWENWTFQLIVENLLDTSWNETQFATESRLFNESNSVEEIHFTPGTPFFLRGKVSIKF